MSTYDEFLRAKAIIDPPTGLQVVPALNHALFDFQRDIVSWALRRGRAALFEDCGIMPHASTARSRKTTLRGVRNSRSSARMSGKAERRCLLLQSLRRKGEAARLGTPLRYVRCAVLSPLRGAGHRRARKAILLSLVLHGLADREAFTGHVSKDGTRAHASHSSRSGTRAAPHAGRSGTSHRQRQAEQPSGQSGGIPDAGTSRALSLRGYVR